MIWTDALKDNDAKFEKKNEMTEFVTSNASMSSAMENAPQKAGLGDLFEDFQLKQVMEASVEESRGHKRSSESSTPCDSAASKLDDHDVTRSMI